MAWTAPRTWVTNEVVTSTIMNTHVRDNELSLMHPYDSREYTEVSVVNTASELTLYASAPVIVGNDLGTQGTFYSFMTGVFKDNHAAGVITLRIKLGATTIHSWTLGTSGTNSSEDNWILECWLEATGATNTQRLIAHMRVGGNVSTSPLFQNVPLAFATSAIDMTASQTWDITAQPSVTDVGLYIKSQFRKQYLGQN